MSPFVILGATKTGTSTAVSVANTHPNVFCLFEANFSETRESPRNAELVAYLPETASLFGQDTPWIECFTHLEKILRARQWKFERLGTKVPGINPRLMKFITKIPVLFMIRDIRIWAVKNRIITDVMDADEKKNIAPFIVDYAKYFLSSFQLERCVRFRLENLFESDPHMLPETMSKLLDLPRTPFEKWWNKVAQWTNEPPKNYSNWTEGHLSAFLPPIYADTRSILNQHSFWDSLLPIFDKYYNAVDQIFSPEEILSDMRELDLIASKISMSINEGFCSFETFKAIKITHDKSSGDLELIAAGHITMDSTKDWVIRKLTKNKI